MSRTARDPRHDAALVWQALGDARAMGAGPPDAPAIARARAALRRERHGRRLTAAAVVAAVVLAVLAAPAGPAGGVGGALHCVALELGAALVPLLLAARAWRRRHRLEVAELTWTAAAAAGGGALLGQLFVTSGCHAGGVPHALAAHAGGVALATLAAAALARLVGRVSLRVT